RFVTTFSTDGRVVGDMLAGDLLVAGSGNPSLVDEDALLVADQMIAMGIRQGSGDLKLYGGGQLVFGWQPDEDGARLRSALSGSISPGALAAVRALELEHAAGSTPNPSSLQPQGIRFVPAATGLGATHPTVLITHRSQPLLALAKSLNDYS